MRPSPRLARRFAPIVLLTLAVFGGASHAAAGDAAQRKVEFLKLAQCPAKPVVVFENGLRLTLDTWDKVIPDIAKEATVFAYNRPGYGKSDATEEARDGRTIVDELRATLRREGLRPPYVLVGHSLGGLYVQVFARAYPNEVAGLVLVDAMYPGVIRKTEDFPWYTRAAKRVFFSRTVNREIDDINATGRQILALPWTSQIPVERLFNVPKSAGAVRVDFGAFDTGPQVMAAVNGLYPNANTTVVDSDHRIQVDKPDVVVAAIRRVLPQNGAATCP